MIRTQSPSNPKTRELTTDARPLQSGIPVEIITSAKTTEVNSWEARIRLEACANAFGAIVTAMSALAPTPVDQVALTQGVWAAKGAWGSKAKQASDSSPQLKEGQEECNICFESAVDVRFVPCKHGSCNNCVDQLRAAAVFKVRLLAKLLDKNDCGVNQ